MFFMFLSTDIANRVDRNDILILEATCPSGQRRVGGSL